MSLLSFIFCSMILSQRIPCQRFHYNYISVLTSWWLDHHYYVTVHEKTDHITLDNRDTFQDRRLGCILAIMTLLFLS